MDGRIVWIGGLDSDIEVVTESVTVGIFKPHAKNTPLSSAIGPIVLFRLFQARKERYWRRVLPFPRGHQKQKPGYQSGRICHSLSLSTPSSEALSKDSSHLKISFSRAAIFIVADSRSGSGLSILIFSRTTTLLPRKGNICPSSSCGAPRFAPNMSVRDGSPNVEPFDESWSVRRFNTKAPSVIVKCRDRLGGRCGLKLYITRR